ncbi:MAG TPA: hypothetical protein VNA20_08740 [Frankiaceae bacterium]|nr:hypothetical protein [Frankiaceae bacterium]
MKIDIDNDVYAYLERHARGFETPNDVLRRLLDVPPAPAGAPARGPRGALAPLLDAGLVKPGDSLVHTQVRKGRTFRATIDAAGWVTTEQGRYRAPSPALRDFVGSEVDGWANWQHERTGRRLRDLRAQLPR